MKKLNAILVMFLGSCMLSQAQSSWHKFADLPNGSSVVDITSDSTGRTFILTYFSSDIYYTDDNGTTWTQVANNYRISNATDIEIDRATGTLYVGTVHRGLFWTNNLGASWSNEPFYTSSTSGTNALINAVVRKPVTNIIVANEAGFSSSVVYKSTNAGVSWSTFTAPFSGINAFRYLADGTLLAGTENGVYKSSNDGSSWTASNTGIVGKMVKEIKVNRSNTRLLAAVDYNILTNDTTGAGVYISTNNGVSWTLFSNGIIDRRIVSVEYDSVTGAYFAASPTAIYKSVDSGISWSAYNTGLIAGDYTKVALGGDGYFCTSRQNGVAFRSPISATWNYKNIGISLNTTEDMLISGGDIYVPDLANTGVHKFIPSTSSWARLNNNLPSAGCRSLARGNSGILFAGMLKDSTGLYRSLDSGSTWQNVMNMTLPTPLYGAFINKIKVDNNNRVYTYIEYTSPGINVVSQIFRSDDSGATWTNIYTIYDTSNLSIDDIDIASDNKLYITLKRGGFEPLILQSIDFGATYTSVDIDFFLIHPKYDIVVAPNDTLYALANNKVYKYDGTAHWQLLGLGGWDLDASIYPAELSIDPTGKLYLNVRYVGIYKSVNDGLTWENITTGIPTYTPPLSFPILLETYKLQFDTSYTPTVIAYIPIAGSLRGIYKYSEVPSGINVNIKESQKFEIYPNPAQNEIFIKYNAVKDDVVHCSVINAIGATCIQEDIYIKKGINNIPLSISPLANGIYFINLQNGQAHFSLPLIKK